MSTLLVYGLVPLALGAVAAVLLLGFLNLARGGSPERSQQLMQWRIYLQAGALVIALGVLWLVAS
jgi:hypothetical protein